MQVILTGLTEDACESTLADWLSPFFNVQRIKMIRDGAPDNPWALIDVADTHERVWRACERLRGVFRQGKLLHFYIPLHQAANHFFLP